MVKKNSDRKLDHLLLVEKAQSSFEERDDRFYYEPLLGKHPATGEKALQTTFLGFKMDAPIWISSMTGGISPQSIRRRSGSNKEDFKNIESINHILANGVREYGLGMGVGSCRVLLQFPFQIQVRKRNPIWEDFLLRPILGLSRPFFANLGIAQIEAAVWGESVTFKDGEKKKISLLQISDLVDQLEADGLIIHINPLQEWLQPEGDQIHYPIVKTLHQFFTLYPSLKKHKIIVKEVGQGMGRKSLELLLEMPIQAIEVAGFGGTNFSKLELLRNKKSPLKNYDCLSKVGHKTDEMIEFLSESLKKRGSKKREIQFILSGGIKNFLDGHYLMSKLAHPSLYGYAKTAAIHARQGKDQFNQFLENELRGLALSREFLFIK